MCDFSDWARRITTGARSTTATDQLAFDLGASFEVNTLGGLAQGWESWMRGRGLSERTIQQRLIYLTYVEREHFPVLAASAEDLARLLGAYTGWTRRTYCGHLRSYFDYLKRHGHVDVSPLDEMQQPPAPRPRPKPLSAPAVRAVLADTTGDLYAWLQLGRLAGLRIHETAKIHGRDVGPEWIEVKGKGGTVATVPTHPEIWRIAQDYPRNEFWFPSSHHARSFVSTGTVRKFVGAHFKLCGIEGSYHRLRATGAQELLLAGHNIKKVQRFLRHASLQATEHYVDALDNEFTDAVHGLAA